MNVLKIKSHNIVVTFEAGTRALYPLARVAAERGAGLSPAGGHGRLETPS
jgi:hypothetical protein